MKEKVLKDIVPVVCIISATILIILGNDHGWDWLLFIAIITKS